MQAKSNYDANRQALVQKKKLHDIHSKQQTTLLCVKANFLKLSIKTSAKMVRSLHEISLQSAKVSVPKKAPLF